MSHVQTPSALNELYVIYSKIRANYYLIVDLNDYFAYFPEQRKPVYLSELNFIVADIMNNEYAYAHKQLRDLCLLYTRRMQIIYNSFFNTQINPDNLAGAPPNNFDQAYFDTLDIFRPIYQYIRQILQNEQIIP